MKFENFFIFYLILLESSIIIRDILSHNYESFFYLCNHVSIFIIIFLILKQYNFLKALINVGIIIQIGWCLDFLTKLIFNFYIFNATEYVFENLISISSLLSILVHTTTLIPLFFLIRKKKTKKITIYYSILYLIFLYVLSLLFTEPIYDINCVFNACNLNFLQPFYNLYYYLPFSIILIVVPSYYLQKKCE